MSGDTQDKPPSGYAVGKALMAYRQARAWLMGDEDIAGDEAAMTAILGPETEDAKEMLGRVLRAARHAAAMEEAAAKMIDELTARKKRYDTRAAKLRETAAAILETMGEKRIEWPDMTVAMTPGRRRVAITDESLIPDAYMRVKRDPNKTLIGEALEAGKTVPGAELGNRQPVLTIRKR